MPAYVKNPIGTASGGVRRVSSLEELGKATKDRRVLVQAALDGPLVMCQSVFDRGALVTFHASLRAREGANGGASHKSSIDLPEARAWLEVLGEDLKWHGALSADVILGEAGPRFIDINPRLVEPENAWRAGVDLVGPMLDVALGASAPPQPPAQVGVATHQLLLAVLGAAQRGTGRTGVVKELLAAARHSGTYRGSLEELTPPRGDLMALVPVVMAAIATVLQPRSWTWFTSGSVENYALTAEGWQQILAAVASTISVVEAGSFVEAGR